MVLLQLSPSFTFGDFFQFLKDFGFYEYVLPFLLVVAIVFAVLEKTQIFGNEKTNINIVIAIVIGMLLVAQQSIVQTINIFLPQVSLVMIVILMILVVITMLGGSAFPGLTGMLLYGALLVAVIAVILALSPGFGGFGFLDVSWISPYDRSMLFKIAVFVGIIVLVLALVTGKGRDTTGGALAKLGRSIEESFRGGQK